MNTDRRSSYTYYIHWKRNSNTAICYILVYVTCIEHSTNIQNNNFRGYKIYLPNLYLIDYYLFSSLLFILEEGTNKSDTIDKARKTEQWTVWMFRQEITKTLLASQNP